MDFSPKSMFYKWTLPDGLAFVFGNSHTRAAWKGLAGGFGSLLVHSLEVCKGDSVVGEKEEGGGRKSGR